MRVEVLYVPGCPHHDLSIRKLKSVLAQEKVASTIVEIEVADRSKAESLGFPGSPTIRINGMDIEPSMTTPVADGLSCRTYVAGERLVGVPPADMIRRAIRTALTWRADR